MWLGAELHTLRSGVPNCAEVFNAEGFDSTPGQSGQLGNCSAIIALQNAFPDADRVIDHLKTSKKWTLCRYRAA
jgi:hypothetical protein